MSRTRRKLSIVSGVMNILRVYHQATAEEMQEGLLWYKASLDMVMGRVKTLPHRHMSTRLTRSRVAGITAALSPNKVWSTNVLLTEQLVATGDAGTYGGQVRKALDILMGVHPLEALRGPKERSFYLCFMGDKDAVTVDGHAYSVWMGLHMFTSKAKVTPRRYVLAAEDYREAARQVGLMPSQIQAVTWLTHRRLHGSRGRAIDMGRG